MGQQIILPSDIPFAEKVPKKGASCASCSWLGDDEKSCTNELYIKQHGSPKLGAKAKRWCCVVWSPEGGREDSETT